MMLELAIGDAYGAGFEFAPREIIKKHNNLSEYISHQKHKLIPGSYTDDTQMNIAIAEMLIEGKEWTPLNLADRFVEVFKRDPRLGYSSKFYDFLNSINSGKEFLDKINPHSTKGGAAMRSSPIGYLPKIEEVMSYAKIQAQITHNTPVGINSAIASSLMTHYFIYDLGKKQDLGKFIESYVEGNWNFTWQGETGSNGQNIVTAAISSLKENSLSAILKKSIDFGGDTDTVATIAMAAASCSKEVVKDLPSTLINNLENGNYGKDYLFAIDIKLKKLIKHV